MDDITFMYKEDGKFKDVQIYRVFHLINQLVCRAYIGKH